MPSVRSPEKYRGAFPGTWSPGSAKQLELRKAAGFAFCQVKAAECTLVPVLNWEHTTWGRWVAFARRALDMPRANGCPDCSVMIVASDQPPTKASTPRFILPPIHCLRPMGRSTTTAAASLCGVSLAPMLCSRYRRSSCCGMPAPSAPTQLFLPADESSLAFEIV